jgi:hypothetical protein
VDNPNNDSTTSRYGFLLDWARAIAIDTNDTFFIDLAAKRLWSNVKKVCQNIMIQSLNREAAEGGIPLDDCCNNWAAHFLLRRQLQKLEDNKTSNNNSNDNDAEGSNPFLNVDWDSWRKENNLSSSNATNNRNTNRNSNITNNRNDRLSQDLLAEFTSFGDDSSEEDETSLPRPATSSTITTTPRRATSTTNTITNNKGKGKERTVVPE